MYFYGDNTIEHYDETTATEGDTGKKNKWVLPLGIAAGAILVMIIVMFLIKKKPMQKFGFKFY